MGKVKESHLPLKGYEIFIVSGPFTTFEAEFSGNLPIILIYEKVI